jgi:hypothetical protein
MHCRLTIALYAKELFAMASAAGNRTNDSRLDTGAGILQYDGIGWNHYFSGHEYTRQEVDYYHAVNARVFSGAARKDLLMIWQYRPRPRAVIVGKSPVRHSRYKSYPGKYGIK